MILQHITPQVVAIYKLVRLRALQDSPRAFGSTFQRESQFSDEEWNQRALTLDGSRAIGYLALDGKQHCGLAVSFLDEAEPSKAHVYSMWVAPEYRRAGVGKLLIDGIVAWSANQGVQGLQLTVVSENDAAIEFYKRLGFAMTGRTEPYPNDPELFEHEMARSITQAS